MEEYLPEVGINLEYDKPKVKHCCLRQVADIFTYMATMLQGIHQHSWGEATRCYPQVHGLRIQIRVDNHQSEQRVYWFKMEKM